MNFFSDAIDVHIETFCVKKTFPFGRKQTAGRYTATAITISIKHDVIYSIEFVVHTTY